MGLLVTDCISAPDTPKAIPHIIENIVRIIRLSTILLSKLLSAELIKELRIEVIEMLFDPTAMDIITESKTRIANTNNLVLVLLIFIC